MTTAAPPTTPENRASETSYEEIRENLVRLLSEHGRNQTEVALKAGLSRTAVRDILTGKSRNPRFITLLKIAKELGVKVSHITTDIEHDKIQSLETIGVVEIPYLVHPQGQKVTEELALAFPLIYVEKVMRGSVDDLRAFLTSEHNMEPGIRVGDPVIVDTSIEHLDKPGVFLIRDGQSLRLNRLAPISGTGGAKIRVMSDNHTYPDEEVASESIEIVGRALKAIRDID